MVTRRKRGETLYPIKSTAYETKQSPSDGSSSTATKTSTREVVVVSGTQLYNVYQLEFAITGSFM